MPDLTNESIEKISEENELFLEKGRVNRKEILKIKLNIENALVEWQHGLGSDAELQVSRTKLFGKRRITISCKGKPCDPFSNSESDEWNSWMGSFASALIIPPKYDYLNGENRISFTGNKQRKNMVVVLLFCILLSFVVGFAGLLILPEGVRTSICDVILDPFYTTFIGACGLCGIPLIFLSVMNGIIGVGNIRTFSTIGTKMIKIFFLFIFALTAVTVILGLGIFNPSVTRHGTELLYSDIVAFFLSIIPVNLLQPFIESNALQLVVLGLGFGVAILLMGKAQEALGKSMINLQEVMLMFAAWVTRFIPLFILIGFVDAIWSKSLGEMLPVFSSFVATTGLEAIMLAGLIAFISVRYKVGIKTIIGKVSKTFLIAFGTDSCGASIPENYSCCATKLGIDNRIFSFGIPIGTTVFKPATVIRLVILCFFMVRDNCMSISVRWLVALAFLSVCVSVACPAIPGGVLMLCGTLFSNLGIPTESVTQMLATDFFFDSFCTAANQIAVSLMLTIYAGKVGMLNIETLRKTE